MLLGDLCVTVGAGGLDGQPTHIVVVPAGFGRLVGRPRAPARLLDRAAAAVRRQRGRLGGARLPVVPRQGRTIKRGEKNKGNVGQ